MRDDRIDQIHSEIQHLTNLKRNLRQQAHSLEGREKFLTQPQQFAYGGAKTLKANIMGALAPQFRPGNVGGLNEVAWPFYFQVNIDFGVNPTITSNNTVTNSFQVDQEACFIIQSIGISFNDTGAGSALATAPIQVEFIDRQSSRRFNTGAVPVQVFGDNSNPSVLPVGMILLPNAFLDTSVSGINLAPQAKVGDGSMQFTFFGLRTRIENSSKVLSTIFGY